MASTQNSGEKPVVICVFCGSKPGKNPAYMAAARALAHSMHAAGAHLVYGGGTVGIMGEVARTLVSLSGPAAVHGVIPEALVKYEQAGRPEGNASNTTKEPAANGDRKPNMPDEAVFGRMTVVRDMHTRKQMMAREVISGAPGSGFVALPGGYGTLEELAEITTWNQLGIHAAPICVLNVQGFYDGILQFVRTAVKEDFIAESNEGIMVEAKDASEVVGMLRDYKVSKGRFALDWDEDKGESVIEEGRSKGYEKWAGRTAERRKAELTES